MKHDLKLFFDLYDNFVHVLAGVPAVLLILDALGEHVPI